jgi:hypothetical protein
MEGVEKEQSLYSSEGENETDDKGKAMTKKNSCPCEYCN